MIKMSKFTKCLNSLNVAYCENSVFPSCFYVYVCFILQYAACYIFLLCFVGVAYLMLVCHFNEVQQRQRVFVVYVKNFISKLTCENCCDPLMRWTGKVTVLRLGYDKLQKCNTVWLAVSQISDFRVFRWPLSMWLYHADSVINYVINEIKFSRYNANTWSMCCL